MLIKFYGVRGSIATPGANTIRYGGNTACVSVTTSDNSLFVLDAGTGIKQLGEELMEFPSKKDIHLLFRPLSLGSYTRLSILFACLPKRSSNPSTCCTST